MPIRSVRSVVANQAPLTVPKTATVLEAANLMKQHAKGALLVVEGSKLAEVMTTQPQTIHPDEPFLNAMRIMHRGGFRHLPVAEHGRPLGMVSARDALDDDLYELSVNLEQQEHMLE
jgi:CBS domain-containing protein